MPSLRGVNIHDRDSVRHHDPPRHPQGTDDHDMVERTAPPGSVAHEDPGVETSRAIHNTGDGGNAAEHVTPVMPVYQSVTHPFRPCVNVTLPYKRLLFRKEITANIGNPVATDIVHMTFRLNSPVDIITDQSYVADPVSTNDVVAGTIQRPMYYSYWSSFYRYYTVTKTEYKITVVPRSGDIMGQRKFSAWTYHHGEQQPKLFNTSFGRITDQQRAFHKHARCKPVYDVATNGNNGPYGSAVTFEGVYYPGRHSVQNDIVEDDKAKTWHRVGEVPPLKEMCTFLICRADDTATGVGTFTFDLLLETVNHVQFRDLKEDYDSPNLLNLPGITDYWAQTDMYAV